MSSWGGAAPGDISSEGGALNQNDAAEIGGNPDARVRTNETNGKSRPASLVESGGCRGVVVVAGSLVVASIY